MTGRHWAALEELARHPLGDDLDRETWREVQWRGWLAPAPAGVMLSPLGRRELDRELEQRARDRERLSRRRAV